MKEGNAVAPFTLFPQEVENREGCRALRTGNIPEVSVFNKGDLGLQRSCGLQKEDAVTLS